MARHLSLSCDKCGKRETAKNLITSGSTRRGDGVRYTVDLCAICWKSIEKEYGFVEASGRKGFHVYDDEDEIPS